MATVNFNVPEEVKAAFDEAFAGEDKSQVVARLMRQAVEEHQRQGRRRRAIDRLLRVRGRARPVSGRQARRARDAVRG